MKKLALAFLLTFATAGTLTYAALADNHRPDLGAMVAELDLNGDGNISKSEIDAKKAAKFTEADQTGDGVLTFEEFEAHALAEKARREAQRRERMFARLDSDGDGVVSEAEFGEARGGRLEKHFDRIDTNGDGMISEAEREAAHEKMKKRGGKHKRGHFGGGER